MQGRQNDASPFWWRCYQTFESRKKVKERGDFCAKKRSESAADFDVGEELALCILVQKAPAILLFFHLDLVIGLNNIPHLDVVVGLDVQTTLHIERNLLCIVLETLE